MRILVTYYDPDGLPRAWGTGPTVERAREIAAVMLGRYRERKREVGDDLANARYTEQVHELPEEVLE